MLENKNIIRKNFYCQERNDGGVNWNLLNYDCGPVNIKIWGYEQEIVIIFKEKWLYLKDDFFETISVVWEFDLKKIKKISENEYRINYDINIVKKYIDYVVIFI